MNRISQYASHASSAMHMLSCMDQPRPDSTPGKLLTGVQFLNAGQKWLEIFLVPIAASMVSQRDA